VKTSNKRSKVISQTGFPNRINHSSLEKVFHYAKANCSLIYKTSISQRGMLIVGMKNLQIKKWVLTWKMWRKNSIENIIKYYKLIYSDSIQFNLVFNFFKFLKRKTKKLKWLYSYYFIIKIVYIYIYENCRLSVCRLCVAKWGAN